MKRRKFLKLTAVTGTIAIASPMNMYGNQQVSKVSGSGLEGLFLNPSEDAGISVVWHWTGGIVTKEGITADLENMASSGINNVMWFSFQPGSTAVTTDGVKPTEQLTPEWWDMVTHMINESKRLGINIAPHINSSWGPAGGPWITPELSQQALVWTELEIEGGKPFTGIIGRPKRVEPIPRGGGAPATPSVPATTSTPVAGAPAATVAPAAPAAQASVVVPLTPEAQATQDALNNYYRELGVVAFPIPADWGETSVSRNAVLTTDLPITDLKMAADPANATSVVNTEKPGYIQFAFDKPFTLRCITVAHGPVVVTGGNPYRPAHSFEVQASDDGSSFRKIGNLEPMLNGWQTRITALTHTVPQTTARYFRLIHNPLHPIGYDESMRTGSRQTGGDFKNMIEPLSFASIVLSTTPTVHHLPCKNATQWGRGRLVTDKDVPETACIKMESIIDLTSKLRQDGSIDNWTPSAGKWKIMRFGYASENEKTGGGLQCDKFNPEAATLTFHSWYNAIRKQIPGSDQVVKILNVDSWEAGSSNWSPLMRDEFKKRRGYDVLKYLPAMTGVMIGSGSTTEGFLLDLRRTIAELITDNFYAPLYKLCHENNSILVSEVTQPTMCSDGMEYFKNTDWTGGEFWVRSNGCWKEFDIADAVAGARLYGKKVIYAEAYTGGSWQEHPFSLKAMGDYHFTAGINRMLLHVWGEQYKPDRVPGIPGAGTPFNHLNTWWKTGSKPWGDYLRRSQALLQEGLPVSDATYFIGENLPSRALVPPKSGTGFITDPAMPDGYMSDSINRDALLNITTVKDGLITLSTGMRYRLLILRPEDTVLSPLVAAKIKDLVAAGAILVAPKPLGSSSLEQGDAGKQSVLTIADEVWGNIDGKNVTENKYGKGRVFWGKSMADVLAAIEVTPDIQVANLRETLTGKPLEVTMDEPGGTVAVLTGADRKGWGVRYIHRKGEGYDFYFLTNQEYFPVSAEISMRITGMVPEFWYADSGKIEEAAMWREENGRTIIPFEFDPSGSVFVVFRKRTTGVDQVVSITGGEPIGKSKIRLLGNNGSPEVWTSKSGQWTLKTKSGKSLKVAANVIAPIKIEGLWNLSFPVKGSAKKLQLGIGSWSNETDPDIKHFSGTATYTKEINVSKESLAINQRVWIDLGDVRDIAHVTLNGKDLGVLWKAPYVVDITDTAVAGINNIEIKVTNTWVNRLVGDVGLPQEERTTYLAGGGMGRGAVSATTPLLPAGILGPVQLITEVKVTPSKA